MATTVNIGNVSFKKELSLTMGGINVPFSLSGTKSFNDVNYFDDRVITVPTSETRLLKEGSDNEAQAWEFKCAYVRNLDDNNFAQVKFSDAGADSYWIQLDPGQSRVFYGDDINVSESEAAFAAWGEIDKISAQADTASVDLQLIVIA